MTLTIILCAAVVGLFVLMLSYRATVKDYEAIIISQEEMIELAAEDREGLKFAYHALNDQLARAGSELAETRARLDAANAVLDVAYVRGDRGHFQRYRVQRVAS